MYYDIVVDLNLHVGYIYTNTESGNETKTGTGNETRAASGNEKKSESGNETRAESGNETGDFLLGVFLVYYMMALDGRTDSSGSNEGIQQYYVTKNEEYQVGTVVRVWWALIGISFLYTASGFREDSECAETGSTEK